MHLGGLRVEGSDIIMLPTRPGPHDPFNGFSADRNLNRRAVSRSLPHAKHNLGGICEILLILLPTEYNLAHKSQFPKVPETKWRKYTRTVQSIIAHVFTDHV